MPDAPAKKLISVVTPCFNEEDNVEACYQAVKALFDGPLSAYEFEHVFCDNYSTDRTVEKLRAMAAADPRVKVILNARNFGPFRSNFNGVMAASGDAVVIALAADQQDPPEVIVDFVKQWEAGHKVVYGIRAQRQEGLVMRSTRRAYYRLVSRFADMEIPPDVGEFQLVDRVVVEALRKCDDYYPYIRGMIAHCGFPRVGVPFTWKARARGMSKNRLFHLIDQALNGIISFTNVPMRVAMSVGLLIATLAIGLAVVNLALNLVYYRQFAAPGIPTLIVAVFFFGGVQLFFMGILGEYIAAIHSQVRKRPVVVERERINFDPKRLSPHDGR
ncbi:MAG: glycosyltransferase [Myxococcales bacterium]